MEVLVVEKNGSVSFCDCVSSVVASKETGKLVLDDLGNDTLDTFELKDILRLEIDHHSDHYAAIPIYRLIEAAENAEV